MLAATFVEAARTGPGLVAQFGDDSRIVFGEEDGTMRARPAWYRRPLRALAGGVELSSDIARELWIKLVYICAGGRMTYISRAWFTSASEVIA